MKIDKYTFEKLDDWDEWYVHGTGKGDPYDVEKEALRLQAASLAKGFYCICGAFEEGYGLYLVPKMGVRYVIESFEVGSHAGADPESVFGEIENANSKNELIPFFADEAGLKAVFSKPVTEEILAILAESVYSAEAMMDDDGEIESFVRKSNGIHLWWD